MSIVRAGIRTARSSNFPHAGQVITGRLQHRSRGRQRSARGRRRLRLVQCRGRHAVARSHARRGQGSGRGALARRRDRRAPQDQIRRAARQAQGRHSVRRRCRICRAQSPNRRQAHARQAASRRAAAGDRGGVSHRQGRLRQLRRRSADRVGRVPRHRYHHAEIRCRFARDETRRRPVEEATERRDSRAIYGLARRPISAPRVNQAAFAQALGNSAPDTN